MKPRPCRWVAATCALAGILPVLPSAAAGLATANVEWIANVPGVTDGVGGRLVDGWFYATDQNKLMIFDVSIPELPLLTGVLPMPQEVILGREDVDTNGEILLLPNTLGPLWGGTPGDPLATDTLYVVDVSDKRFPRIVSRVPGGGGHTVACALDCTWAYSSDGPIVDLRDPLHPVLVDQNSPGGHDIEEVAHGLLLAPGPTLWSVLEDPAHPKLLAGPSCRRCGNHAWHSLRWPQEGQDRFVLGAGEQILRTTCGQSGDGFSTWDASSWAAEGFHQADVYRLTNGTFVDGEPPRNALGCSPHWFDAHPQFRDGGIVALAAYEHGVRFLRVSGDGSIDEVGWFLGAGTEAGAAYWVTDEIVYVMDYARGFDILRFTGGAR